VIRGEAGGVDAAGLGAATLFLQQQRGHVTAAGCRAKVLCQSDKRSNHMATHGTRLCEVSRDPFQEAACSAVITRPNVNVGAGNPGSFEGNRVLIVNRSAVTLQPFRQLVSFMCSSIIPF
jgi:hypothetical protein